MINGWIIFGFFGQLLFGMRFIIQWICSEKRKRSYIPLVFWYLSISGGVILFIYAIHRQDPVFIVGQGMGLFIYVRNLFLIAQHKKNNPKSEI